MNPAALVAGISICLLAGLALVFLVVATKVITFGFDFFDFFFAAVAIVNVIFDVVKADTAFVLIHQFPGE